MKAQQLVLLVGNDKGDLHKAIIKYLEIKEGMPGKNSAARKIDRLYRAYYHHLNHIGYESIDVTVRLVGNQPYTFIVVECSFDKEK